jgi:DNA modification methylase
MAVRDQKVTDDYAIYNGDCYEVMRTMRDASIDMSLYSPPFASLYTYSSDERDLSNCDSYKQFFEHYKFVVQELFRLTKPGRISAVHCIDVPRGGANIGHGLRDFPGDIIRMHENIGFRYCARYHVWKEPLGVRNRTMAKGLTHAQVVSDSTLCDVAAADYLLMFRRKGQNAIPVVHPQGLRSHAGSRQMPAHLLKYKHHKGKQTTNRYSHWIWQQYASAFWDDVRIERVLPYKKSRDKDDERHIHPLQLDVIERACVLWSNPGDVVLTPFMGVGSECYGCLINRRKAIGIELKVSYYRQAVKNLESVERVEQSEIIFPE